MGEEYTEAGGLREVALSASGCCGHKPFYHAACNARHAKAKEVLGDQHASTNAILPSSKKKRYRKRSSVGKRAEGRDRCDLGVANGGIKP